MDLEIVYIWELLFIITLVIITIGYTAHSKRRLMKGSMMDFVKWRIAGDFMMGVFFVLFFFLHISMLALMDNNLLGWHLIAFTCILLGYLFYIKEAHCIHKMCDELNFGDASPVKNKNKRSV